MEQSSKISAIELQGIVRNSTKIGAVDGEAEDAINLRFRDGSWRMSGNGREVWNMPSGVLYSQLYIHTNSAYHHLLGVREGVLYWFANIDNDGVTFEALVEPIRLTSVVGDLWLAQRGHLLSVIDESEDFEYFVFKTGEERYIEVNIDVNGKPTDRGLFPFGRVSFNCHCPCDAEHAYGGKDVSAVYNFGKLDVFYDAIKSVVKKKNQFAQPFLAILAVKLYDGSYVYASNPVYVHPRERFNLIQREGKGFINAPVQIAHTGADEYSTLMIEDGATIDRYSGSHEDEISGAEYHRGVAYRQYPIFFPYGSVGSSNPEEKHGTIEFSEDFIADANHAEGGFLNNVIDISNAAYYFWVLGSDLVLSIDESTIDALRSNADVISSLCIFITPEVDIYQSREKDEIELPEGHDAVTRPAGTLAFTEKKTATYRLHQGNTVTSLITYWVQAPPLREDAQVINELIHSQFYLLREYNLNELDDLLENPIVDLSLPEYNGLLENLVQQDLLTTEALSRTTYLPKTSYMYNGRLHIANYKVLPFCGYPIDLFQMHNHSLRARLGAWFDGVLPNLGEDNDAYLQYKKIVSAFPAPVPQGCSYFAYAEVEIETAQGTQKVVRYIAPYDRSVFVDGRADFVESLNPLITYPDARAKKMRIVIYSSDQYKLYMKSFDLRPHPYLNLAYYIDADLKPIEIPLLDYQEMAYNGQATLSDYDRDSALPIMVSAEENFPNGLRVSKTDNPMYFPVENAYQIGSSEILALMSNTIAVGTGQTGAAPLYVFCKDGIYALFVDSSGQMTYSNARAIARDVCNNPRSVTPIDAGVVFTTDRGLMLIAGEQVQELGAPCEGDVLQYADSDNADYIEVAKGALTRVAKLPDTLCDATDFLTYLQDAIINYNYNDRELIVSNPDKSYSYVCDREGSWSRRDYTADEYVQNYPTSYRFHAGKFYKVDEEGGSDSTLEHRKEADNRFFYLSRPIKLGSIGFKQSYRFVVRGLFHTTKEVRSHGGSIPTIIDNVVGCYVFGSYDGRKWALLGGNEKRGTFTDIGCKIEHTDVKYYRVCLAGQLCGDSRIDHMEMSSSDSMLNVKIR